MPPTTARQREALTTPPKDVAHIKCGWCSAPWSDANLRLYDGYSSQGCSTCGHGSETTISIEITCHKCKKLMYKKVGYQVE